MRQDLAPYFVFGQVCTYPTGESPTGADCLNKCGTANGYQVWQKRFFRFFDPRLWSPFGGTIKIGVNGFLV